MPDVSRRVERALDSLQADEVAARIALRLDQPAPKIVVARVRSRTRARHDAIVEAIGARFCVRNAHELVGVVRGRRRSLGACAVAPHAPFKWDYWFPHLGIAVDRAVLSEEETHAKVAWADAHGIIYFSPRANAFESKLDLIGLAEVAARRRAAAEEAA